MLFSIIHDLDSLSEKDRRAYADSCAVHFGLDPTLNPFDFIWMTQDSGFRKLCLYARRGTTDILREKHQISVVSLIQHDGPGYVSFTATGKNPAGRQEIAVGSSFTDGLRGESLAHGVMTAQTRALRRMTLQFVGIGILDVSEVNAPPETEQKITTPISLSPAPVAPISNLPGKDITPVPATDYTLGMPSPEFKAAVEDLVKTAEQNRQKALDKLNEPTEASVEAKKTRKRRAKVDLGPSEPVQVSEKQILEPEKSTVTSAKSEPLNPEPAIVQQGGPETISAISAPAKPRLSQEQVKPYRQRHFRIVSEVLEPAGFAPKEGVGNAAKMLSFAQMMFPDVTNMNYLTAEQWEKYLTTLETKINNEGAPATITYIEESIGL